MATSATAKAMRSLLVMELRFLRRLNRPTIAIQPSVRILQHPDSTCNAVGPPGKASERVLANIEAEQAPLSLP